MAEASRGPAELLDVGADVHNVGADVHTMDARRPRAQALARAGGRVLALGEETEQRKLAGSETRVLDAGGASVLPGLIDAHEGSRVSPPAGAPRREG